MTSGSEKWPDATQTTLETVNTKLDAVKAVLDSINDKTPPGTDIKSASESSTSSTNATVLEVASGSGWLLDVSQYLAPYAYGTNSGYVTITIDGVSLGERLLSLAEYAGSYPGTLAINMFTNLDTAMKYETSLKVEHRITKDAGAPTVYTAITYTED